jgi:hypothetical protein
MSRPARRRMSGTFDLPMWRDEAFVLFTPEGERQWADGWDPQYPAGRADDTEPGTVFQTAAHGQPTTWVVVDRDHGRMMSYARITEHARAGTVTVTLDDAAGGGCVVTVSYDLTALSEEGAAELDEFAATFQEFLRSWREAISPAA